MFGFLAQLLAWCFDVVPNYAGAILLFTLIVMAAVTPFTIKGMRSAAEMSRLQPEMKKLQDQYKNDRVKQNEEIQALFKEHGVNPLGGCLPMLLPLPIFFIIFRLLRGLNGRHSGVFSPLVQTIRHQPGAGYVAPHYLTYNTTLTQHLIHSLGQMKVFGMDLALTAKDHHATVADAIPFFALIAIMTVSQYWQQRQMTTRNPQQAQANPQMNTMMKVFPAFYAVISLSIPASVVFYLLVSGLFRMAQTALSYRFDPILARAAVPADAAVIDAKSKPASGPKTTGKAALTSGAAKGAGKSSPPKNGRVTPSAGRTTSATAPKDEPVEEKPAKAGFFQALREAAKAQQETATSSSSKKDQGARPATNAKTGRPIGTSSAKAGGGNGKGPRPDGNGSAPKPAPDEPVMGEPDAGNNGRRDEPVMGEPVMGEPDAGSNGGRDEPRSPLSIRPSGKKRRRG